jgi:multidrug efflux pump subunit AcrA (membrane-fusion protein)
MRKGLVRVVWGLAIGGIAALLVWGFIQGRSELANELERERPIAGAQRVSRGPGGEIVVTLDREGQSRVGVTVQALAPTTLQPEIIAPGFIQEDPARSFTLRAPVAGVLRRSGRDWPGIGAVVGDGAVIGVIEPRVGAMERVDLASRLASARSEVAAATAALSAARAAFERAKTLNADGKIASDRALQEAEAKMRGEEARLTAASETASLLTASVREARGPTGPMPLLARQGGEVVEVLAQPGEAVESGQPILRVARFDRVVARVELPLGERVPSAVQAARIVVVGYDDRPLRGELIGRAASDPKAPGQALLFRVTADRLALRPGEAITAYLMVPGAAQTGVTIPLSAVIRFAGKAWAYAQIGAEKFARRDVALDRPTAEGWFIASGFAPGDRVVVGGAQMLLSEELKSQVQEYGDRQ